MRVIVTRPAAEAAEWVDALRARGFDALALSLIDIRAASDTRPLETAWTRIETYRAAMFVSANAVRGFFAAASGRTFAPRAWATGAGTRAALIEAGVAADRIDSPSADARQFDSEALWQVVSAQCTAGDRALIVRGGEAGIELPAGRDWLSEQLASRGVHVDTVLAYVRACPQLGHAQRDLASRAAHDGTVWLFSSSQAIDNLRQCLPAVDWSKACCVATHPRIAQAAHDASFGVVCVSRPPMNAVIAALESLG